MEKTQVKSIEFKDKHLSIVDNIIEELRAEYNIELDKLICIIIGTIIAAYLVIFNFLSITDAQEYLIIKVSLITSLFLLIISLLSFTRHILRFPKRVKYSGERLKKIIEPLVSEYEVNHTEFVKKYLLPSILFKFSEQIVNNQDSDLIKEEAYKIYKDEFSKSTFAQMIYENYLGKATDAIKKENFYLPEKMPRINYYLDAISENLRYVSFVLGMTFLLIAITTFIIIK